MQRSSFLIRFIDIGLIILFGFITISDIDTYSRIDMPGSDQSTTSDDPKQMTLVTVEIAPGGVFTVVERASETVPCQDVDRDGLEECLVNVRDRLQQAGEQAVVLVEPDERSIVQHTVDVLDICDRHGILKNINASELKL